MNEAVITEDREKSRKSALFEKISKIFLGESGLFRFDSYLKRQIKKTEASPEQLGASLNFARWAEGVFKTVSYDNFHEKVSPYRVTGKDVVSIVEITKKRANIQEFADKVFVLIDPKSDAFPSVLDKINALSNLQNIDLIVDTLNSLSEFIIPQLAQNVYVAPAEDKLFKRTWKNEHWVVLDEPITSLASMDTEEIEKLFSSENKEIFKQLMALLQKKVIRYQTDDEPVKIDIDLIPPLFSIIENSSLRSVLFSYLESAHSLSNFDIKRVIISIPYLEKGFSEIISLNENGFEVSNWISHLLSDSTLVDLAESGATYQEWRQKALERYPNYDSLKPITQDKTFCANVQILSRTGLKIDPHYTMDDESSPPVRKPFFYEFKPTSEIELIATFYQNGFDKFGFNLDQKGYFPYSQIEIINKYYKEFFQLLNQFSIESLESRMNLVPDNFFQTLHQKNTTELYWNDSFILLQKILSFNTDLECQMWVKEITRPDVIDTIHGHSWLTEYAAKTHDNSIDKLNSKIEYFFSDQDVQKLTDRFRIASEHSTDLMSMVDKLSDMGIKLALTKIDNVIKLTEYSTERRNRATALLIELHQFQNGQQSFFLHDHDFELIDVMSEYAPSELESFYDILTRLGTSKKTQFELIFRGGYQVTPEAVKAVFENTATILSGFSHLQTLVPAYISPQSISSISQHNFSDYIDNLIIMGNNLVLTDTIKSICAEAEFDFELGTKDAARSLLEITNLDSSPETEVLSIARGLKENAHYFNFHATDVSAFKVLKHNPRLLESIYLLGQQTNYIFRGQDIDDLLQNNIEDPQLAEFIVATLAIYPRRFEAYQAGNFAVIEDRNAVIEFLTGLRPTSYDFYSSDLSVIESIAKDEKLHQFCLSLFEAGVIFSTYEIEAYRNLATKSQEVLDFVQENPQQAQALSHNLHHFKSGVPENISSFLAMVRDIDTSQSQDVRILKEQLISQLKKSKDPDSAWREIESVFIKNHLPLVGKIYKIFEILYPPELVATLLNEHERTSPTLRQAGNQRRRYIFYRDLLDIHIKSGNRSLEQYIDILLSGEQVCNKFEQEGFSMLNEAEKVKLAEFFDRANVLYANSSLGLLNPKEVLLDREGESNTAISDENFSQKLTELKRVIGIADHESLFNRLTQMYALPLGKSSIQEIKTEMTLAKAEANQRGLTLYETAESTTGGKLELTAGTFLKAVNEEFFHLIGQNGSVSQEFLGSSATSDLTPFDTDLSIIPENHLELAPENGQSVFAHLLGKSVSGPGVYGNLVIVMRDRGQFNHTDTEAESINLPKIGQSSVKPEIFKTGIVGETHYGIRTGFPITDVDFMIFGSNMEQKNRNKVLLEIAKNGYYVPITDEEGNIIFTPDQYNQLRTVFAGIPYLSSESVDINLLSISENLELNQEIELLSQRIVENRRILEEQHATLENIIQEVLAEHQIKLFDEHSGNVLGAELDNTGSTSRFTSAIGNHDYDYALFMDALDYDKKEKIYESLADRLQAEEKVFFGDQSFSQIRFKNVTHAGLKGADVDIGMIPKNQERGFASHQAVALKLASIAESRGQTTYETVVANIVFAKQWLKDNNAYGQADGFFGGIAVENLIIQHKGNIVTAFSTFVNKAETSGSYEEFRKEFQLWNPGTNARSSDHNDLLEMMTENGFKKTLLAMKAFLEQYKVHNNS